MCAVLPSNTNALLLQLKGVRARSHSGLGAAPRAWMRPPGRGQVLTSRRMTWTSSLPPLRRRSCLPCPPLHKVPGNPSSLLKPSVCCTGTKVPKQPKLLLVNEAQIELCLFAACQVDGWQLQLMLYQILVIWLMFQLAFTSEKNRVTSVVGWEKVPHVGTQDE